MRRMRVGRLPVRNPQRPSPRRTMPERSLRLRPVQEPVKKERNWRSIFKRTLDKINEGFNAADDEEI